MPIMRLRVPLSPFVKIHENKITGCNRVYDFFEGHLRKIFPLSLWLQRKLELTLAIVEELKPTECQMETFYNSDLYSLPKKLSIVLMNEKGVPEKGIKFREGQYLVDESKGRFHHYSFWNFHENPYFPELRPEPMHNLKRFADFLVHPYTLANVKYGMGQGSDGNSWYISQIPFESEQRAWESIVDSRKEILAFEQEHDLFIEFLSQFEAMKIRIQPEDIALTALKEKDEWSLKIYISSKEYKQENYAKGNSKYFLGKSGDGIFYRFAHASLDADFLEKEFEWDAYAYIIVSVLVDSFSLEEQEKIETNENPSWPPLDISTKEPLW